MTVPLNEVLLGAGLAFVAVALFGGGEFGKVKIPTLPTRIRLITGVVGAVVFIIGLVPGLSGRESPGSTAPATQTESAPSTTVAPSSPQPTGSPKASSTAQPSASALPPGTVTIDHPGFASAKALACEPFSGRANLLPGDSLALAVQNASVPGQDVYLQPVHDWDHPGQLSHWSALQFFGARIKDLAQSFRVTPVIMKLGEVHDGVQKLHTNEGWHLPNLPTGAVTSQSVLITRAHDPDPKNCHYL